VTHLTPDELRQWMNGALDHDRTRVIAHLASCDECAAQLAAMARDIPGDDSPIEALDTAAFRDAGLRAGSQLKARPAIDWQRFAIAATVLLALGGTIYYGGGADRAGTMRGTGENAVAAQSPSGEIDGSAALRFSWTGTAQPVRLVVVDVVRPEPLIDRMVTGGSFEVPVEERSRFDRGRSYRWFVEYRDESGAIRTTPTTRFSLR
jgi:hypothetical protein